MKVKLMCKEDDYNIIKSKLEKGGFSISEDSDLVLYDRTVELKYIMGKIEDEYEVIKINDIVYIESFSHDIVLHTSDEQYLIKEKLYQIEGMLENQGFIRVNQSTVINKEYIKRINPTFNSKFIIKMKNGVKIEVTRSYYYKFKALMKL